jgi:hypothetical protein
MSAYSLSRIFFSQGEHRIGGTPEFKCPDLLKVLALEKKRGAENVIDTG